MNQFDNYVYLPEALSIYIRGHRGLARQIAHVLHVNADEMNRWARGNRRVSRWRVTQIRAVLELGLVQNKGGNGRDGRHHV